MTTSDVKAKAQEIKRNADEINADVSEKAQLQTRNASELAGTARAQIQEYGSQIRDYLNRIQTDVETYRFLVEKTGNGLTVDFAFKATIRTKEGAVSK